MTITLTETQSRRRGHRFMPPKALAANIPGLAATDGTGFADKIIWLHYFSAGQDWWVAELGDEDGFVEAFCYTRQANYPEGAEWAYVSLEELEQVNAHHGLVIVERDLHWEPRKFGDIKEAQR